jgi:hypothetical protein
MRGAIQHERAFITEISIINLQPKSMQVNEFNMKYNIWGPTLRIANLSPTDAIPGKKGILDSETGNAHEELTIHCHRIVA